MAERNTASGRKAQRNTEAPTFTHCMHCNTILNHGATVCHWCGSTQIEENNLLDIACYSRAILRSKTVPLLG